MTIKGKAYIAGAYEHPTRKAPDKSRGATACRSARTARSRTPGSRATTSTAISAPATRRASAPLVDGRIHRACELRHVDSTETGGSSYIVHVGARGGGDRGRQVQRRADHAGRAAAQRGHGDRHRAAAARPDVSPRRAFEVPLRQHGTPNTYAMCAMRHMHEYGTTSEQLAWIKVAASHHAQHNPHAMLRDGGDGARTCSTRR